MAFLHSGVGNSCISALVAAGVCLLAMGTDRPEAVRTTAVEIVDAEGKVCGRLDATGLRLHNARGALVYDLSTSGITTMNFYSQTGAPIVTICESKAGPENGEFALHNGEAKVVRMGCDSNGDGIVSVCNEDGEKVAVMSMIRGRGAVMTIGKQPEHTAALVAGSVICAGPKGNVVCGMLADEAGKGHMWVADADENDLVLIDGAAGQGRVRLRDAEGAWRELAGGLPPAK